MAEGKDYDNRTKEQLLAENIQLKKRVAELEQRDAQQIEHNRAYFNERLEEETARSTRYNYEFSVLLLQLDNLESYSNKFNIDARNEVLGMLIKIIHDGIRKTDICCQFEPGEYALILPYTNAAGARLVAERLRQTTERVFNFKSMSSKIPLTLSLGIASYPKDAVSSEHLLELLNKAVLIAQDKGGDCSILASDESTVIRSARSTSIISACDDMLIHSLDDEVLRCSRYGQKFSLLLMTCSISPALKNEDNRQIRKTIQELIRRNIRTLDRHYCRSENNFAVLLPGTDADGAEVVSEKLLKAISASTLIMPGAENISIILNIGAASFPFDEISRDGLLQRAEDALAESLKKGSNNITMSSTMSKALSKGLWDVNEWIRHLKKVGAESIYNMIASLDLTEQYARPHSQTVARYAMAIGQGMGLSNATMQKLRIIALFHDMGKMCIPKELITKPGTLSTKEWDLMLKHPQMGADILSQFDEYVYCVQPVLSHHERWDGYGYPNGLRADKIPVESRIVSVAEALDDMVTPRPYKQCMPLQQAIEELKKNAGTQFDPRVVQALLKSALQMQKKSNKS